MDLHLASENGRKTEARAFEYPPLLNLEKKKSSKLHVTNLVYFSAILRDLKANLRPVEN